ncbi:MAG: thiamine pyrophosphate-dependent enzyme [Paracoccaceae bacterium]|jgi:2-oxoisovalerate dehydrogenase E1 component|nr:thiamine pyrophosphate-dependent enzyme [Paracoccaceae bacterium]
MEGASADRAEIVHTAFRARIAAGDLPPGRAPEGALSAGEAVSLFRAQCLCRALDRQGRAMQRAGTGFYTIGSSGHEGMAAVAHALRPTDMAFLHYRDAAFQIARAAQVEGQDPAWDILLSFACAADDPISGGRHKVLGSKALTIPPQTSTIASHLPKAMGAAYAVGAAKRHRPEHAALPDDALVMASFGDASANHSTALGAINAACWTAFQGGAMPLLLVCEDNGIGISVKTPPGWIEAAFSARPGLRYVAADGLDLYDTCRAAREAAEWVRTRRRPAFLHLRTVRLYGHAGADVPTAYLSSSQVEADEANDPLLHSVRLLAEAGALAPDAALAIYDATCAEVAAKAEEAGKRPHLRDAGEVMASLIPPRRPCRPSNGPDPAARAATFGGEADQMDVPQPMVRHVAWALADLMLEHPEIVVMGEDVGAKGGVYGATRGLQKRFGRDRVIDTLLDEQSILGLALGMAHNGFVPIPEIQFLAYLHNAEDQLRGEAATLPFFSNGQFANPMVVRIAGLGYQKGFGGHFHNDNALAVLRDIPGLILACPSTGADAARMLRECVRLAREEARVCVFLEPIALYTMRDLEAGGDGGWASPYPAPPERLPLGAVGVHGAGSDLALLTFGNGHRLCRQAQTRLAKDGVAARVIDLRWLAPLPEASLLDALAGCGAALIVDETRRSGGVAEGLVALMAERAPGLSVARLTAEDSFIATGPAHAATLPSTDGIVRSARALVGRD